MGSWLVNWAVSWSNRKSVGWTGSRAVGLEVGRSKGKLLGGTEKVPWSKRKSLCPRESLHVEPTDFQSNKPNYRSTDWLPLQPTNFPSNRPSISWTEWLPVGPRDFQSYRVTSHPTDQPSVRPTNIQSNRPSVGPMGSWSDKQLVWWKDSENRMWLRQNNTCLYPVPKISIPSNIL